MCVFCVAVQLAGRHSDWCVFLTRHLTPVTLSLLHYLITTLEGVCQLCGARLIRFTCNSCLATWDCNLCVLLVCAHTLYVCVRVCVHVCIVVNVRTYSALLLT